MNDRDFFQNFGFIRPKKIKIHSLSPHKMHVEDGAIGLAVFLSLAYWVLSSPAHLLISQ